VKLQSSRLLLEPCDSSDIDLLHQHWTEPLVRRHLFDERVIDIEMVSGFVAASHASFAQHEYGLWVLRGRDDDHFRGVCGLYNGEYEDPELLFSIATPYWQQGFATESAQCVLHYAFDILGLKRVVATVDPPNIESINVLEKLGMTLVEEQVIQGNPILFYEQRCP
jgi:[ribosomal protein S5]-alanine N-acetyltransferase